MIQKPICRLHLKGKTKIILAKVEIIVYLPTNEYSGNTDFRIGWKQGVAYEKMTLLNMKQIVKAKVIKVTKYDK